MGLWVGVRITWLKESVGLLTSGEWLLAGSSGFEITALICGTA